MLQAPKKDKKEEDEEDLAFKKRKQEEAAALKAAKDKGACLISCSMPHTVSLAQLSKVTMISKWPSSA